ncbi:hypothetical protein MLD38_010567 [Melastoma candidum]|uniref:Uncharacterized protein n=1 Tax=Melastoma candidum TaxID=119954 RepID=A0ACB9R1C2_9MYRT|nr:hypothetical protein MLD38_010567 [Melastoma candidum]
MYTFLPETESTDSYFIVGIILEAVPWVSWLFMYLYYYYLRPGVVSVGNYAINGGPRPWSCPGIIPCNVTTDDGPDEIPSTPLHLPGRDDWRRHVHFGSMKAVGKEESNGAEGVPLDMVVSHACGDVG